MKRALLLPVLALVLIAGVLGIQLAHGGGDFAPAEAADPCAHRTVTTVSKGVDGLGERLVLLGLDGAACRLGETREALALQLAEQDRPTDAQVTAVRAGLYDAIARMKADGTLPLASDLVDDALEHADLPGYLKTIIRHLPDSVVNKALDTDDVLRRTVGNLDIRALLTDLHDPDRLQPQITAAVSKAVRQSLEQRLRDLI